MKFRLRFSLRTLFITVTFVAIFLFWIMWQEKIVRHRQLLLRDLEAARTDLYDPYNPVQRQNGPLYLYELRFWAGDFPSVPWYRKVLGDRAKSSFDLPVAMSPERVQEYCQAFPEAQISQQVPATPHAVLQPGDDAYEMLRAERDTQAAKNSQN